MTKCDKEAAESTADKEANIITAVGKAHCQALQYRLCDCKHGWYRLNGDCMVGQGDSLTLLCLSKEPQIARSGSDSRTWTGYTTLPQATAIAQLETVLDNDSKGDVAFFTNFTGIGEFFLEIAALKEDIAHGIGMPMESFVAALVHHAAEPPETDEETAAGLLTMVEQRGKPKLMLMHVLDVRAAKHDDLTRPSKGSTDGVAADTNGTYMPDEPTVWHDILNRFSKQVVFANITEDQLRAGVTTQPAKEASDRATPGTGIAELLYR